jgi:agmatinase
VARGHDGVGIDRVEAAPDDDRTGSIAILAAQLLRNLLGSVFEARATGFSGKS